MRESATACRYWLAALAVGLCFVRTVDAGETPEASADEDELEGTAGLPWFEPFGAPYRTPRAGEGFRFELFGQEHVVEPRDRRFVESWDIGVSTTIPGPTGREILPFGSLYFWHHPDEDLLFRGIVVGVFNDLFLGYSPPGWGAFELVTTFSNLTVPADQAELVEGTRIEEEELQWGWLRPGIGLGYRIPVRPWHQDNMLELSATVEPGYTYFSKGSETSRAFTVPQDTFDLRGRVRMRLDAIERNLLSLPHEGLGFGLDLIYGHRTNWEPWGIGAAESIDEEEDYLTLSGYVMGATGVPFSGSERHRLIAAVHGGAGDDLDRFSAFRIGGGPNALGEEYGATARAILPGAAIEEFFPRHYAIFLAEYRWEPIFFTYLTLRGAVGYLDRDRFKSGTVRREDDVLAAVGTGITTGFLFKTRLEVDYNYNFGVIRRDGFGTHEVVLHVSGEF